MGVGTLVLAVNVVLLGGYTFGCHSLRHLVGGFLDQFSKSPTCYRAYACVGCLNRRHMLWAWMSLFWVGILGCLRAACARSASGTICDFFKTLRRMPDYETFTHDVLVIGTGGAGLRAAIEASAAGVSVGMVSKCLLGKAHTVMAEGGIAAALANVDDRDNWKVHFADTMRGGQYVNNWRMAELHAREAPDARARTRGLGRRFRSHEGRPDSAEKFRRP